MRCNDEIASDCISITRVSHDLRPATTIVLCDTNGSDPVQTEPHYVARHSGDARPLRWFIDINSTVALSTIENDSQSTVGLMH